MDEAFYLHQFRLYKTQSKFYVVGRNKSREQWKMLKIDRFEPSDLVIEEDGATYSKAECDDLVDRINDGNMPTGGLKFVTNGYGIVGFIKFLGPYYLLVITKRRKIGTICGHAIYAIVKTELIPLPNSTFQLSVTDSKSENRYKKLLSNVDLTKDFFFSYSYNVMRNLQKNFSDWQSGHQVYDSMFVWNEFLTRSIRNRLRKNIWTVALVFGFFKQVNLSVHGKNLQLTLIARRSRHYAGTRYLKRGVNEKGRVANEVEIEQIVSEDIPGQPPNQISSAVQHRGSIPLFWSQENSWLNPKPSITLHRRENGYEATRLHFENLVERYGNPIIILNLIKIWEKKPRESILGGEFANAIDFINNDLSEEDKLRFLHWDIQKHSRSRSTTVLPYLNRLSAYALGLTGIFYSQLRQPPMKNNAVDFALWDGDSGETLFQRGVLRTNCIDCLDRTNVAQYAYGLAALRKQLIELGLTNFTEEDLTPSVADDFMTLCEMMGDTLAMQYGGSGAHNKIFCEKRGQWKASIQSQELFRVFQRYYSNTYVDAEKQDAINLFLGHFQPQQGKPALWELGSDQLYNIGHRDNDLANENARASLKRSLSDSNISSESNLLSSSSIVTQKKPNSLVLPNRETGEDARITNDTTPEVSPCDHPIPYSQYASPIIQRRVFWGLEDSSTNEHGNTSYTTSNFLHFDWLPASRNSFEEIQDRSSMMKNRSGNDVLGAIPEMSPNIMVGDVDSTKLEGFSEGFIRWVDHGGILHH